MYKDLRYLHQEFEQVSIWIWKMQGGNLAAKAIFFRLLAATNSWT